MVAVLHFRVDAVGVNLEFALSRWREEEREKRKDRTL